MKIAYKRWQEEYGWDLRSNEETEADVLSAVRGAAEIYDDEGL
jgi:hypothetical protein